MANPVSAVTEDYLKAIYTATEWGGTALSVSKLAAQMGVVASTASENVRRLTDTGLIDHIPYRGIQLTEEGKKIALRMVRRHRLLETYLHAELGFEWDQVHEEAEILEHAVSDRLIEQIALRLGHPAADPHGDPIPGPNGEVEYAPARPLSELTGGQISTVVRICDAQPQLLRHLEELGLTPGAQIEVLENREYAGTWVLQVGEKQAELGAVAVANIFVS